METLFHISANKLLQSLGNHADMLWGHVKEPQRFQVFPHLVRVKNANKTGKERKKSLICCGY